MNHTSSIYTLLLLPFFLQAQDLKVTLLSDFAKPKSHIGYFSADVGKGNTSVDQSLSLSIKHSSIEKEDKEYGYFDKEGNEIPYLKRNRDLGQTFTYLGKKTSKIKSITLRTGWGANAIQNGMYGQKISLQLFEISGVPTIHNNDTKDGKAYHGYPHNRYEKDISPERDDYIIGETYIPLAFLSGGVFPSKKDFGFEPNDSVYPDHAKLKGRYLRFELPKKSTIRLNTGKRYAFLIMIDSVGPNHAFALANNFYGKYEGGHATRREGNGVFPPVPLDLSKPLDHPDNQVAVQSSRLPGDMQKRLLQQPGTNGYPDVDTWRDLWFCIELE